MPLFDKIKQSCLNALMIVNSNNTTINNNINGGIGGVGGNNINNNSEIFDFLTVFVRLFNAEEDSNGNLTKLSILRVKILNYS